MPEEAYQFLRQLGRGFGQEIHRPGKSQLHFLVVEPEILMQLSQRLQDIGCYLVSMVANDERELEENCFKLYYLFSHPEENVFFIVEYDIRGQKTDYPSIYSIFPAVDPFEKEIVDLFGLHARRANSHPVITQGYLHACYPEGLFPLRRNQSLQSIREKVEAAQKINTKVASNGPTLHLSSGEVCLPVGPVHAGVIEPGQFLFRVSGEWIEDFEIHLGYTHKGIERLFQSSFTIQNAHYLAERVSGDSAFVHSLAYCKAVEVLAQSKISSEAKLLRALFLEVERIANHIGDCGELAHDIALEMVASELAVLREEVLRLNESLTGSRFLKGVNRPGGVTLLNSLKKDNVLSVTRRVSSRFLQLAQLLVENSDFRGRTTGVGVLTKEDALKLGVTGLIARASGIRRDFRLQHPFGPYADPQNQHLIRGYPDETHMPVTISPIMQGDVFSRFLQRVFEVDLAHLLIENFMQEWPELPQLEFVSQINFASIPTFEFGIGYAEGWRGDVVYWLMKDRFDRIYRCKVRDPSTLNWPGLKEAVETTRIAQLQEQTSVADFPVINKSFNLSYSGNDL
jgi:Ni,Fe-hydrogenase III large subunit/Ni,Fe-hydrogenase III component G